MSLSFKDAKKEAKKLGEDWRSYWKYGEVIRGIGVADGELSFDWGPEMTNEQKNVIEDCLKSVTKWGETVEWLLDNPPSAEERRILKLMKKLYRR